MNNEFYIGKIVEKFKERFSDCWLDRLNWDKTNCKKSLGEVQDSVRAFKQDMFDLFAHSVLQGEYITYEDYDKSLESLYEQLANAEMVPDGKNGLKSIAVKTFNDMTYQLGNVILRVRHLMTMFDNKYGERQTKFIVNAYRVKHKESSVDDYVRYYDILIGITVLDHSLSYEEDSITKLIIYHSELKESIEQKKLSGKGLAILEILDDKCLFLLKKLLVDDDKEFDYMIDFNQQHYDARELSFKYFMEMNRLFEFYRADTYSNNSLGRNLDVKACNKGLAIGQFSLLMKYYKDSNNTDLVQIDNILADFNSLYEKLWMESQKKTFERYSLCTLKNYMYNCRFSFLMQDPSYTFDRLKNDLNQIIGIQNQTGVFNFYPYRKAFNKALVLFHQDETIDKNKNKVFKDFLSLCISKFAESIEWCKTYHFYPIQNQYQECLVPVDGFGDVFIASSFCRPVKYVTLQDDLISFKNQLRSVDNEIALREGKMELKKIRGDIEHSKTREIEILSAFTAVITFLFGTIGFFAENENNNFIHLVFSIFGLGAILLIFVSGIHLVTMSKEEKIGDYFKHPRAWLCIFTILASIGLLIWLILKVNALAAL